MFAGGVTRQICAGSQHTICQRPAAALAPILRSSLWIAALFIYHWLQIDIIPIFHLMVSLSCTMTCHKETELTLFLRGSNLWLCSNGRDWLSFLSFFHFILLQPQYINQLLAMHVSCSTDGHMLKMDTSPSRTSLRSLMRLSGSAHFYAGVPFCRHVIITRLLTFITKHADFSPSLNRA